jgi:CRP-like cAMP-binding protein
MISTELLRHYPFFGSLNDDQLRAIAMIAEEVTLENGETLFQEGQPADALYFLEEGCIDLYYTVVESPSLGFQEGIPVGEINPGEAFSISALIEPHILTSTARASKPGRMIKIDAKALLQLFKTDQRLAYLMTQQAAKAVFERLHTTRVQLAAAWV